jgi:crotonobetainyl-CoA:carnitine CoA-transferase CaiB-like acyl-CoA transferase
LAIDLSALWAGPLCGQLLRQTGVRVIKVESAARPEPSRQTLPVFFDQLNAGKESVVLDFDDRANRVRLRRLIEAADIVISSARPRALEQLDLDPAELVRDRPALVWIAITAHGWHGSAGQRVGFGDDAAAAAGLVATGDDGRPAFMGDAIADPLTGLSAAAAALRARLQGAGGLYDISLRGCAERVAGARRLTPRERGTVRARGADWCLRVDDLEAPVSAPWTPPAPSERAAPAGAHTQRILEEIDRRR